MEETGLIKKLEEIFRSQGDYLFDKHVPEFTVNNRFLGDFFSQLAVEPKGDEAPVFYYTYSPFDVISGKAPHRAAVFEDGEMLLEVDFDKYTSKRTAAMTPVLLRALGKTNLVDKKLLILGSGKIAKESLVFIKAAFSDVGDVSCINRSGDVGEIQESGKALGVNVSSTTLDSIGDFDVIICHTNTKEPILGVEHLDKIKKGALITSFISSTEHGELADEYFDSKKANIICDWETTIGGAKEVSRAIESGLLEMEEMIYLTDLLQGNKSIDANKGYTVYRSTGTPMQNLAVLKLLLENK